MVLLLHIVRRGWSSATVVDTASTEVNGGLTTARRAACNAEQAPSGWVDTMPDELAAG